ncbi:M48 family metallopeptidase [Commensalibacter sp. M0357]|nr:M48 family metallopeptidase [Commensalibacter sp. M0357]MBI0085496.1 M48 family metallopeptidase [Commensalibacter sp. M0355]
MIITLTQHLIKANPAAIYYVILHELCHAAEFNHSKKIYQIVTMIMPN